MKIGAKQVLTCILLILYAYRSEGQDSSLAHDKLWRLEDCIRYARDSNIQIVTQRLNTKIAHEYYLMSRAAVLPDLYGNAGQNFVHSGSDPAGKAISANGNLGFGSSMTLYRGGWIKDDIQEKNHQIESANLLILQYINDITVQVTQAFLTVLLDKENIVYFSDLANTSKAQLDRAGQVFKAGSMSRKDFVEAQAQYAQDRYNLTSYVNNERRDRVGLKQLLQITDTNFDIVKPDTIISIGTVTPLAEVKSAALASRPEIRNADISIRVAELELAKARANTKPSLNLSSGVGTNYSNENSESVIRQFDNNFYQQAGLSLTVPIFTKRVNKTYVNIAKLGIDQAKLNRDNTRTVLELNIERAYINLVNAQEQYDAALTQLSSAAEVYHIANEELRIGSSTWVEMILQRNQYIQALQNYLNAKYNAALAARIYDFYMGVPIKID